MTLVSRPSTSVQKSADIRTGQKMRNEANGQGNGHQAFGQNDDLVVDRVTKAYGTMIAVNNVSLSAKRGEFISFLGPSGCGKSTTLSMIAGFQDVTAGAIYIRGKRVDELPPEKRNTGMVFQNYALFPHMSLAENVGFGLRMRNQPKDVIQGKVKKALELVRMGHLADRRPSQLSGGQQQRVALARALVIEPDILLLDEPLGALDRQLRQEMQLEIKELQSSLGITTIFVTHDQEEALSMSERVVVMNAGGIEQIGTPTEIYERPATQFVAGFVGKSNRISGQVIGGEGGTTFISTPLGRIAIPALSVGAGTTVECVVRPEKVKVASAATTLPDHHTTRAKVRQVVFHGSYTELHLVGASDQAILASVTNDQDGGTGSFQVGAELAVSWKAAETLVFQNDMLRGATR